MNELAIIQKIEKKLGITLGEADVTLEDVISYISDSVTNAYLKDDSGSIVELSISVDPPVDFELVKEEIASLTNLKALYLGSFSFDSLDLIKNSSSLQLLGIGRSQIENIDFISGLTDLQILVLNSNSVSSIYLPDKLQQLERLIFKYNGLNELSIGKNFETITYVEITGNSLEKIDFVQKLPNLEELVVDNNRISNIEPIRGLKKLSYLMLLENNVADLSPIEDISSLRRINAGRNLITSIPSGKKLKDLGMLWLISNPIMDLGEISSYRNVTSLSLGSTGLQEISFLKDFTNLHTLHLQENSIQDVSALSDLSNLEVVELADNMISDISTLKNLFPYLTEINLSGNHIKELPPEIVDFGGEISFERYSEGINLYNNPIKNPPLDIVKEGMESVRRYFENIEKEGVDTIYEIKLTLVGQGGAGKTSLQRRILDPEASLPQKDSRTRGIAIQNWEFEPARIAHIWDFGGQDVYYPVHRFFITENSIFVLLASTRLTTHDFDYWIPTIYQFGGDSPIILGQTCHDGNHVTWNDLGAYVGSGDFNIIKTKNVPYYQLDLRNDNEGLDEIKEVIVSQIKDLSHYGQDVPKSWVSVRNELDKMKSKNACISFDKFKEICLSQSDSIFKSPEDFRDCCQFLHNIGVIIWYSNIFELKDWVILQPEWAMNAVYRIIDDKEIQERRGNIMADDFDRLWSTAEYVEKHGILRKMLEMFKIAFPKRHAQNDYLIPARLVSMPSENRWKTDEPGTVQVEFSFDFMPRGLVNQLSAELSRYILSDDEVWNNAVNFTYGNETTAQVEEVFHQRKITIRSKGPDARSIIVLIMDALKNITDGYKGVEPEISVPCICSECVNSSKPTLFPYNKLLEWSARRNVAICNESLEQVMIDTLLFNVGLVNPKSHDEIKIFLASSSELESDRREFEIFVNRENKRLIERGLFIRLEIWEDFIDAMSSSRLQDEYNKVAKNSDIFISLFHTKVGKYTEEEFNEAFGAFEEKGRPFIYTYFKNGLVDINSISAEGLASLKNFKDKLSDLGHYPTEYDDIADLKYKFKMQLDALISKNWTHPDHVNEGP